MFCLFLSGVPKVGCVIAERQGDVWARSRHIIWVHTGACFFSFRGFRCVSPARCWGGFFATVLSPSPRGCCFGFVRARLRHDFCLRTGACFFSFRGFRLVTSPRCGGGFFARFEPGFRWCLAVLSPSPGGCRSGCVRARLRRVFCLRAGACFFSFRGFRLVTSPRCGGGFFARFEPGFRWCLAVLSPSPGGCRSGCVRARLRRVFCLRAGACFFSFRGFRLVTSPRCGGGFFARFEPGFRWCLAVLSPSPGGCRSGCVRARLRRVFCLRAGACFFSFRGFRLVTSPRCGGGFFARFEPGFRWCLAVLSPSPGGCRSGCGRARLRGVFCLRAGACFFSFRGFRLVTSPRCGGRFFARFEPGFRWCLAVLSPSPGGCRSGCVRARLRRVFCLRAGACFFSFRGFRLVSGLGCVAFSVYVLGLVSSPLGVSDLSLRHGAGEGFLLGLSPDLDGVWLF